MANKKHVSKDYFGLDWIISMILVIIPPTAWICGALTRFKEGKLVAGLIRIIFGLCLILFKFRRLILINSTNVLFHFQFKTK